MHDTKDNLAEGAHAHAALLFCPLHRSLQLCISGCGSSTWRAMSLSLSYRHARANGSPSRPARVRGSRPRDPLVSSSSSCRIAAHGRGFRARQKRGEHTLKAPAQTQVIGLEMLLEKRRIRALARLAKRAGVAANTVSRFENGSGAMVDTLERMQTALESAGVVFIPADHTGGPGVRLREASTAKANRSLHADTEANITLSKRVRL